MKDQISKYIQQLKNGELSEEEFQTFIENFPYHNLGNIKLDFHRKLRRGLPEAIFGSGKTVEQLETIVQRFMEVGEELLITRVDAKKFSQLSARCPGLVYHRPARVVTFDREPQVRFKGSVLVLSGGSSDEPVAEEAFISSRILGNQTDKAYDVGVACISRVLDLKESLNHYTVVIVVAGMEGALPSVVAGLTATPVIAVPTSIGYGANFQGVAALLSMLNTCSGGISVVNIDNGFGAAFQASLINQKITKLMNG